MITFFLLILIYLAFISLGLPDALLGVSWPIIRNEMGLPLDGAALIAFVITGSTFTSSLLSGRIIKFMGTGKVVFVSCLMTSLALLGFSIAPSYIWFILFAVPLGLGAGAVDTGLNHYVAIHFKAHHMNWLHSFWGVGATGGPMIMSAFLLNSSAWRTGYKTVGLLQLSLAAVLLFTLPLWKLHKTNINSDNKKQEVINKSNDSTSLNKKTPAYKIPGVKYALLTFVAYCTVEGSVGLWGSSYLIETKSVMASTAAQWVAFYYSGIALGRFFCGFISFKLNNKQMITLGINILAVGILTMFLPFNGAFAIVPLILIGFGLSPIFPAMIHETPIRFGQEHAPDIIGYQMAAATFGLTIFVPLIGTILKATYMGIFPILLLLCIAVIYLSTTRLALMFKN